jgi:LacI family transcriptional regulator
MIYTFEQRREGYLAALREAGISPCKELLIEDSNLDDYDSVYASCKRLVDSKVPFSAIFCASDPFADKVLKAFRELGIRVPQDVSVVGFDNADVAEHLTPPLTTVCVHKEAMGALAVKTLISRVAEPQAIGVTSILAVDLIKRESVRKKISYASKVTV